MSRLSVLGVMVLWIGVVLLIYSLVSAQNPSIDALFLLSVIFVGSVLVTALSIAFFRLSEKLTTDED